MPRRSSLFLLEGELFDPTLTNPFQPDVPAANARAAFIAAINELAPEVASTLRTKVWTAHRLDSQLVIEVVRVIFLAGEQNLIDNFLKKLGPESIEKEHERAYNALLPYIPPLFEWAADYNLAADWFLASALHTLVTWEAGLSPADDRLSYAGLGEEILFYHYLEEQDFEFSIGEWNYYREKESAFREKAHHELNQALDKYISNRKKELLEKGCHPIPEKRTLDHYDWLVRWQVQGWTKPEIARQYRRSKTTIEDGLKIATEAVGIELVKRGPGRPRKTKK